MITDDITLDLTSAFCNAYRMWYVKYIDDTIDPELVDSTDYIMHEIPQLDEADVKLLKRMYEDWVSHDITCVEKNMERIEASVYMYAHRFYIDEYMKD